MQRHCGQGPGPPMAMVPGTADVRLPAGPPQGGQLASISAAGHSWTGTGSISRTASKWQTRGTRADDRGQARSSALSPWTQAALDTSERVTVPAARGGSSLNLSGSPKLGSVWCLCPLKHRCPGQRTLSSSLSTLHSSFPQALCTRETPTHPAELQVRCPPCLLRNALWVCSKPQRTNV